MQVDSIASTISTISISSLNSTVAASTQVTSHGKAEAAVVEHTSAGYEAYVQGQQQAPPAVGSSIDLAESRLNSTVQFQA